MGLLEFFLWVGGFFFLIAVIGGKIEDTGAFDDKPDDMWH